MILLFEASNWKRQEKFQVASRGEAGLYFLVVDLCNKMQEQQTFSNSPTTGDEAIIYVRSRVF